MIRSPVRFEPAGPRPARRAASSKRWTMLTDTRARTYDEMVDALAAEGLPQLQDTLASLTAADWERPTLLQPPEAGRPPWTVLQLAAHFDVFMGLALGLVAEPTSAPPTGTPRPPSSTRSARRSSWPWRRSGPRRRTPSGPGSWGPCGWRSSWPPGWWKCRCMAWT